MLPCAATLCRRSVQYLVLKNNYNTTQVLKYHRTLTDIKDEFDKLDPQNSSTLSTTEKKNNKLFPARKKKKRNTYSHKNAILVGQKYMGDDIILLQICEHYNILLLLLVVESISRQRVIEKIFKFQLFETNRVKSMTLPN